MAGNWIGAGGDVEARDELEGAAVEIVEWQDDSERSELRDKVVELASYRRFSVAKRSSRGRTRRGRSLLHVRRG